jgi:hypothetical protein
MPTAQDESPRQLFRVVEVAEGDVERWLHWRRTLVEGGTFTDFSGLTETPSTRTSAGGRRDAMRGALRGLMPGRPAVDTTVEVPVEVEGGSLRPDER